MVGVFAVVGACVAYGLASVDRADLPGLATASDGRWVYPELTRPPLPEGSPGPLDPANKAGAHHADLRALLLPPPDGAEPDRTLPGAGGWLATRKFIAQYASREDREALDRLFTDHGLRRIAARGWTAQDGTHTRVYLLQFATAAVVDAIDEQQVFTGYDAPRYALRGASEVHADESFPVEAEVAGVRHHVYAEPEPYGAEQVREAYLTAGDTLALIVQSRKDGAAAIPFQQTVVLQSRLLG